MKIRQSKNEERIFQLNKTRIAKCVDVFVSSVLIHQLSYLKYEICYSQGCKAVDVVPTCGLAGGYPRFGGTYCLYNQPWRWRVPHRRWHSRTSPYVYCKILGRLSDNWAFWWKALLRVSNVNIWDGNSNILIIFYGLFIMSLWGPEGWGVAGFCCRETARRRIDRAEHCCWDLRPSLTTPASASMSLTMVLRAVWGSDCPLHLKHSLLHACNIKFRTGMQCKMAMVGSLQSL